MPFIDNQEILAPLGLPDGFDLNPDAPDVDTSAGSVLGAAFRTENTIYSMATKYEFDPSLNFDPSYNPWDDIGGTPYEDYADSFVGAHNAEEVQLMKAQIDREMEDKATLDAAGGWGMLASMGAAILSPTSFLPGGAVVKGAKGIQIGRSAMSVSFAAAAGAGIDEVFLQASQETRTGAESAFAIGGSVILGGLLGGAAGALGRRAQLRASASIERLPEAIDQLNTELIKANEGLSTAGAMQVEKSDMQLRGVIEAMNGIPILRGIVRTDPLLRAQLSSNVEVRRALVGLTETVLQYSDNELGQSVMDHVVGRVSAETAIKTRRNVDLGHAMQNLNQSYKSYARDGAVGVVGRFTAPITGPYQHLLGMDRKLSQEQFMKEVGLAAIHNDQHPIPQVQQAAQMIRKTIFDKAKQDLIDLGIFDESLQLKYGESYLTRVYNRKKIEANVGSGGADDIMVVLRDWFSRNRSEAQNRLAFDTAVRDLENEVFNLRESARGQQTAMNKAIKKAKAKKSRALAAITRENAVSRATAGLRRLFERRSSDLSQKTLEGSERAAFEEMVRMARRADKMEPPDIFAEINRLGGIKDDGSGELAAAVDQRLLSIRRKAGMDADDMRQALEEGGYIPEGLTVNEFYEVLREANNGKKVYSNLEHRAEIEAYEAAIAFRDELESMGVDIFKPIDEILNDMPGYSRNQSTTRAKAKEAGRSASKAGKKATAAQERVLKALDRLEEANARLAELDDVVGPKVRAGIKADREALSKAIPELKKAQKAQSADEYYAGLDDLAIQDAVEKTVNALIGLKEGEHAFGASMSNPVHARTLDVPTEVLQPWLETDMGVIMNQYFNSIVPTIEISRRFGDVNMTEAFDNIRLEANRQTRLAKTDKERTHIATEARTRIKELKAMRDRLMGVYGVPKDPDSVWVRGARTTRTVSYTGYLGGMTLAAIPDVAGVVGRNGIEAAFGSVDALTNPSRMFRGAKEAMEDFGSAADWWLNSRSLSMAEVMDPYGQSSRFGRGLGKVSSAFTKATGMTAWNAGWKSVSAAMTASKISKAAMAVLNGNATKKQRIALSENGISNDLALRIADQVQRFGDMDGHLWLPHGSQWDSPEAFQAMQHAMTREMDIAIITPGQDKPLGFSGSEAGRVFSQFKTFTASAHHRILISGIQRADAAVLAQVTTAVILGALVSNIKADLGGYDRKSGNALWVDAIDRAGIGGWLLEGYNIANTMSGGRIGEPVSRYQSRNLVGALAGPSFGMATSVVQGANAIMDESAHSYKDVHKIMRAVPGNNLPYLLGLFQSVEDSITDMTGGKPRPES